MSTSCRKIGGYESKKLKALWSRAAPAAARWAGRAVRVLGLYLDDLLILRERQQKLAATWLNIPEDDRMLLEGKYLLGLSDGELAELAGCKSNSVRMKLTRARRNALKIMLDKEVEWI